LIQKKKKGAGDSGKSTIGKQMRILYQKGFPDEDKQHFKCVIHSNVMVAVAAIAQGAQKLNISLSEESLVSSIK
jgi:hypothetical protein